MDYLVVAGDWKMVAVVDKWRDCGFFRCCVGFFVSFDSLVSWNPDDCGVCVGVFLLIRDAQIRPDADTSSLRAAVIWKNRSAKFFHFIKRRTREYCVYPCSFKNIIAVAMIYRWKDACGQINAQIT